MRHGSDEVSPAPWLTAAIPMETPTGAAVSYSTQARAQDAAAAMAADIHDTCMHPRATAIAALLLLLLPLLDTAAAAAAAAG